MKQTNIQIHIKIDVKHVHRKTLSMVGQQLSTNPTQASLAEHSADPVKTKLLSTVGRLVVGVVTGTEVGRAVVSVVPITGLATGAAVGTAVVVKEVGIGVVAASTEATVGAAVGTTGGAVERIVGRAVGASVVMVADVCSSWADPDKSSSTSSADVSTRLNMVKAMSSSLMDTKTGYPYT